MSRSGADLALLLLGGFRSLVSDVQQELARRGYEDVRPVHEFAIRAIAGGADSASDLGRRTAVTKQSAAHSIAVLQQRGYVSRQADPADARRKRLRVTQRGVDLLREGEAVFDELLEVCASQVGRDRLKGLEADLTMLVGDPAVRLDAPGWVARHELGEPSAPAPAQDRALTDPAASSSPAGPMHGTVQDHLRRRGTAP